MSWRRWYIDWIEEWGGEGEKLAEGGVRDRDGEGLGEVGFGGKDGGVDDKDGEGT